MTRAARGDRPAFNTLIEVQTLDAHLGAPNWIVLDCRFDLADPAAGRRAYQASHLPGARYVDLNDDLAGPVTCDSGRHPLPETHTLAGRFGRMGIGPASQVVVYDDASGAFAARAWWLLRWLGHSAVCVLDGGFAAWNGAGKAVDRIEPRPLARDFEARIRDPLMIEVSDLQSRLANDTVCVLDARAVPRFRGEYEPIDAVAGHVPGAVNFPFTDSLGPDGRFLGRHELLTRLTAALGGREPAEAVAMCGSGVTACHVLLAMEHAGLHDARLYVGSWSEWIRDPSRPTERDNTLESIA